MNEEEQTIETVIRFTRLREELKPLPIWTAEPLKPIDADWVGINHIVSTSPQRSDEIEKYGLAFYRDNGEVLEYLEYDSLDTALDQAKAIAGIESVEWLEANVTVTGEGRVPWKSVG